MRNNFKGYFPIQAYFTSRIKLKNNTKNAEVKSGYLFISLWNTGFVVIRLLIANVLNVSKSYRWLNEKWIFHNEELTLIILIKNIIIDYLNTLDIKNEFEKNFFIKNEPNYYIVKFDSFENNFELQEDYIKRNVYTKNDLLRPGFEKVSLDYDNQLQFFVNSDYGKIIFRQSKNKTLNKQVRDGLFYTLDYLNQNLHYLIINSKSIKQVLNSLSKETINFIATNLSFRIISDRHNGPFSVNPYFKLISISSVKNIYEMYFKEFEEQFIAKFDQLNEFSKSIVYENRDLFSKGLILDYLKHSISTNILEGYMDIKDNALLCFAFAVAIESYLSTIEYDFDPLIEDLAKKRQISTNTVVTKSKLLRSLTKEDLPYPYKTLKLTMTFSKEKIYNEDPLRQLFQRNILIMVEKGRGRPRKDSKKGNVQFVLSPEWQNITKIHSFFNEE